VTEAIPIDYAGSDFDAREKSTAIILRSRIRFAMRLLLLVLGFLAALLIIGQLVMGQLILSSGHLARWTTAHKHSGYMTVVVVLLYIGFSLGSIASQPKRPNP
jgi:hypothetical protein